MSFFNQKVKKGRSKTKSNNNKVLLISIIAVVAVIIIGVLISVFFRNSHDDAIVKIRDVIAIEVNNENVDKNLFFEQLENVKEKDIKITYKNVDFVKSCQDNSNKDCIIDFYDLSLDQKGEKIDYRNYTKEGSYEILIVASDASGNKTSPMKATLTIGNDTVVKPITCKYGNAEYDTTNILAVNVTKEGCALDLNLYNDENVLAPVNELIKSENEKIKKELSKINLGVKNIHVNSETATVLNTTGKGVVGYTLKFTVSIEKNNNEEVIEEYYININGGREFITNKYL